MTSIEEPLQGGSEPLYFTKESTISANGTDEQTPHCNEMVKNILASLKDQSEIVIDFTSLKTCLNPMGLGDANTEEVGTILYNFLLLYTIAVCGWG